MKFRFTVFLAIIFILSSLSSVSAQVDSVIGQITNSGAESLAGGISGDGRFIVFESRANIATENPRNADGNLEIFLFDYAQRRVFQITDTKNLLVSTTESPTSSANIKVVTVNTNPVISNDGKWIAFSSNATCNYPGDGTTNPPIVNGYDPTGFDPNVVYVPGSTTQLTPCYTPGTGTNAPPVSLYTRDANTELWLYRIPDVAPVANLSLGAEIPFTNLNGGTLVQATNTLASLPPTAGTANVLPFIADDNRNSSINDDGSYVAFVSSRDLEPCTTTPSATCGNAFGFENNEIFLAVRTGSTPSFSVTNKQLTASPRPTLNRPSSNNSPSISGNGLRIAFISTEANPLKGMVNGTNTDYTEEIFYADVDATGNLPTQPPTPTNPGRVQITDTVPATPGTVVNVFDYGKRISRDGRFIAFDSYAAFETTGNPIQTSFATYVFDDTPPSPPPGQPALPKFVRVMPRSDADSAATGGDLRRYPTFTDYQGQAPGTLVFESRLNITTAGTIPSTAADGLNPDATRPAQVFSLDMSQIRTTGQTFKRISKLPPPTQILATVQPLTSNSLSRMTFSLARTETGTGNFDLSSEVFYLLTPTFTRASSACCSQYYTGATRLTVSQSPVPSPSPTATPTATPTVTPTPTPTGSPTPTPSPTATPIGTASAVQGISPGMLAIVDVTSGFLGTVAPQTAVGSLQRNFSLPIELSGVTMTINGAACGLKKVSSREITFVVPFGLAPSTTPYDVVINNNGRMYKTTAVIVITRPDIFSFNENPSPGGRARIYNATNRVLTREPFNVTTLRYRGGRRVPTVLRLYMTGIFGAGGGANGNIDIRLGGIIIPRANIGNAIEREPGVYSVDFTLPPEAQRIGDVPVVVVISTGSTFYYGRGDDTTSFVRIL